MAEKTNVIAFKGNLPALNINTFQKALAATKNAVGVTAGGKQFLKLAKNDGAWIYGQKDTAVEEGSLWAINPMTLQTGFVAWKKGQPVGKRMGSIFNAPITRDELNDVEAPWAEAVAFDLTCISGEDIGTVCEYSANSYGGRKAFTDLMDALMKQSSIEPDKIVPVVELVSDEYEHREYGITYNPVFEIKSWATMSQEEVDEPAAEEPKAAPAQPAAAAPAEAEAEAEAEAPRRRRAGPVTDVPATPAEPDTTARRPRRRAS